PEPITRIFKFTLPDPPGAALPRSAAKPIANHQETSPQAIYRARWLTCSSSVPPTAWHGSSRFSRCSRHISARLCRVLCRGIEGGQKGPPGTIVALARCYRSQRKKRTQPPADPILL